MPLYTASGSVRIADNRSGKDYQMPTSKYTIGVYIIILVLSLTVQPVCAHDALSKGETVYVSIYSHVYSGPKLHDFQIRRF